MTADASRQARAAQRYSVNAPRRGAPIIPKELTTTIDLRTANALATFADFTARVTPPATPRPRHRARTRAPRPVYPVWPTSPADLARLLAAAEG